METVSLIAEKRDKFGTSASRNLRLENKIPAIIYGDQKDNECITINNDHLMKKIKYENIYSKVLIIEMGENKQKVILKSIHRHHYKNKILHMDFQRVQEESIISTKVPINIINQKSCIGLISGGKIIIKLIDAEIKCKAKYLPEKINLDIKGLKLDQSVYLSDLNLSNGIVLLALKKGYNKIIASIKIPKKLKNELSKGNSEDEVSKVDTK